MRGAGGRIRVVVTGLGAVTPLGVDVDSTWEAARDGRSRIRAITRFDAADFAVRFAGEVPGEIDLGDLEAKEARRLDRVVALSIATKGVTGHLLRAACAVEALFCVRALETGVIPPTVNLEELDPECELDPVANKARQARVRVVLSNSFGFGGTNACLVLGAPD